MKNTYYLVLFVTLLFGTKVLADTDKNQQHTITVSGTAKLYVPIDQVELHIEAYFQGETAKKVESKGYQVGLKLKKVFKQFGITEKAIRKSDIKLTTNLGYRAKGDEISYKFNMYYIVRFQQVDLIDSFREQAIKAGATGFFIEGLINNNRAENKVRVKKMAYQNAKMNAEAIIQSSGLKLGLPLSIDGKKGYGSNDEDYLSNTEGLGSIDPREVRESLFRQKQLYLSGRIEVTFSIDL